MLCSHCKARLTAIAIALASCAVATPVRSHDATADQMIEAIWRVQNLPFEYDSVHSYYACDSLESKIRAILLAVGAHDSVVVQARCVGHFLTNSVSARIALATPVHASEENIRIATTFDTKDELVARLRKTALPTPTDVQRFPAMWRTKSLGREPRLHIDAGDCELLQDMNRQIFPKLAVQLKHEKLNCNASATRIRPRFEVHALIPIPAKR